MSTIYSSDLAAMLASAADKIAYLNTIRDALGSSRTLTLKKFTTPPADWNNPTQWNALTTIYAAPVTGTMGISDGALTNLGTVGPHTVRANADLSTGFAVMRIEGGGAFMQGTVGLAGATGFDGQPVDFVLRKSPNGAYGIVLNSAKFAAPAHLSPAPPIDVQFTLQNWATNSTRTLLRAGMPFKKGDIPAGSRPEIRVNGVPIVAQFDERTTWSDGSLKFAVCHLRDDNNIGASSGRQYTVHAVSGSFDNTGATSLASVAAANALTVEFSNLAQWDGSTSATRGSGAALASLAAHASVSTRVTKIHSGPVCEGWVVWGMAKDGAAGAGAEDAHLKAIWYIDVWKDAGGAIIDTEFAAELAQNWWAVAGKYRLDYTATLKRNGTTVQAYAGVQHPYQTSWLTARMTDDHNHGKRHWVTAVPTISYVFSRDYWKSTRLVPSFDTSYTPTANAKITYSPLSAQEHRAAVDGTGAYMGRGVLPNCDAITFIRQTPLDFRNTRVNAFAGLHIPQHFRDERTRTRSGEAADMANTLVPLIWSPKPSSASTFTGLPEPKNAYAGSATPTADKGGFVTPLGGTGVWANSPDASHAVPYSVFAYMVEGERYFLDASIDLATNLTHAPHGNEYASKPFIHWYFVVGARDEMSIPATRWAAIPSFTDQERSLGWSANRLAISALVPDSDPQGAYMRGWNQHCADYLNTCLQYTPPSLKASGTTVHGNGPMQSPWMAAIQVMGCCNNFLMTETEGFKNYADLAVIRGKAIAQRNMYDLLMYRAMRNTNLDPYSPSNHFQAPENYLNGMRSCTVSGNTFTLDEDLAVNGDTIYFLPKNAAWSDRPIPSGLSEGVPYYVVQKSGETFKISATVGGSPLNVPDGFYDCVAGRFTKRQAISVATDPPYLPNPDSYPTIHECSFAFGELAGLPSLPPGTFASVKAFLANVNHASDPRWAMSI